MMQLDSDAHWTNEELKGTNDDYYHYRHEVELQVQMLLQMLLQVQVQVQEQVQVQ